MFPYRTDRWDEIYTEKEHLEKGNGDIKNNIQLHVNEEVLLRNTFMNAQMQPVNYL